jgi:hypothetical protein
MKKRDMSAHVFYNQVKFAADTLASIGQPLRDTEFAGFILNGLDQEYDGLVEAVEDRETPISQQDLLSRLLSTEQRVEARRATDMYSESSANASYCGSGNRGGSRPPQGGGRGAPRSNQQPAPRMPQPPIPQAPSSTSGGGTANRGNGRQCCQLCGVLGHIASRYYKRFNHDFRGLGTMVPT